MELEISLLKNDDILVSESFNGNSYYEGVYTSLALKYDLITLPLDYFENSLAGLRRRREFKLNSNEKEKVINSNLSSDERQLLDFINVDKLVLKDDDINIYFSIVSTFDYGNLEDIKSFFEENECYLNDVDTVVIKKID